eukprot:8974366-Pyramimonas_sp.AAC.1
MKTTIASLATCSPLPPTEGACNVWQVLAQHANALLESGCEVISVLEMPLYTNACPRWPYTERNPFTASAAKGK